MSPFTALAASPVRPIVASPLPVLGADVAVPVGAGRSVSYANFDVAATAPCAVAAAEAVTRLLPSYASVHRGAGLLSVRCTEAYEQARDTVHRFLGCRPDDQVIFTRNTTDALNLLAHVLPADVTVVTFVAEHHANLLPWRRVVRLPVPHSPDEAVAAIDRALAQLGPALVAVTGASNVTGEVWPIADIVRVARRYGARVAVDAAQLAAHQSISIEALGVDYVALSGHKLYAPFGVGVLAGRADWFDLAQPYLAGGGASAQVPATGAVTWATGPARHEAGTPNLFGAVALAAVCASLTPRRWAALVETEQQLLAELRAGLAAIPGVRELRLFGPEHPRVGIVSFVIDGHDSGQVARRLADEHGIGVRAGLFCAHPLTRQLLATHGHGAASTAVRASLGAGTTGEHVRRLVAAVGAIAVSQG